MDTLDYTVPTVIEVQSEATPYQKKLSRVNDRFQTSPFLSRFENAQRAHSPQLVHPP